MNSIYQVHVGDGGAVFSGSLREVYDYIVLELDVHPMDVVKSNDNEEGFIVTFPLADGNQGHISTLC